MSSVSIIHSDNPEGPADKEMLMYEIQQKREDPEALILEEYSQEYRKKLVQDAPDVIFYKLNEDYCKKLGGITMKEFFHKLKIFAGTIEDDEKEWREKKYGKQ